MECLLPNVTLYFIFYLNTKSRNLLRLILLLENVLSILFIQSLVINVYFIMIFINVIHVLETLHFVQVGKTKMHNIFSLHAKIILKPGTIFLINFLYIDTGKSLIKRRCTFAFAEQYKYFLICS